VLRLSILVMVLAAGCMAADEEPTATIEVQAGKAHFTIAHPIDDTPAEVAAAPDVCAAAAELPPTDVCSLICDPPAMAAYLIDEGMQGGTCYQLRCVLPGNDNAVMVGVCLAPS
jgi:hypothetical protein